MYLYLLLPQRMCPTCPIPSMTVTATANAATAMQNVSYLLSSSGLVPALLTSLLGDEVAAMMPGHGVYPIPASLRRWVVCGGRGGRRAGACTCMAPKPSCMHLHGLLNPHACTCMAP